MVFKKIIYTQHLLLGLPMLLASAYFFMSKAVLFLWSFCCVLIPYVPSERTFQLSLLCMQLH